MTTQPRGIRNNNPGNIRWGDPWQGLVDTDKRTDKDFCQFQSPTYGIRALARTLITYQDKYKILTIRDAIARWAPDSENDTAAYQNAVAKVVGVAPSQELNFQDYTALRPIVEAIIRHENGNGPLATANTWYDAATIDKGLALAGVEPVKRTVAKMPVTHETVAGASTGLIGVAQLADIAPRLVDAITNQQDHLTSGNVAQIVLGFVLVGLAVFIAWSQISKHKKGTL